MSRTDRIALLLCFCSLLANALVGARVFENISHLEDELTFVWQAETIARGQISVPSPPSPGSFMVPFVVDYQGWRFGKYPLGFPVLLSFGIRLGLRDWVNPFIAAWSLWLIYRLGKKLLGEKTALLAVFLTGSSPFYLINSANLLSHAWSLFLSCALALAWLEAFCFPSRVPRWLSEAVAGFSIGALALTRPWTAVGVSLPFVIHGLFLLWKGPAAHRRSVLVIGLVGGAIAALHLLWQAALTGSPWINPYTLWWSWDRIGFGPGIGFRPGGHTLIAGLNDMFFMLGVGASDLFGWPWLSYLFIPFGVLAIRHNRPAQLVGSVFPALVTVYVAYWVGSWLYGPRYYYEGLYSLSLLSAAGIAWVYRRLPLPRLKLAGIFKIGKQEINFVTGPAPASPAGKHETRKSLAALLFTIFLGCLIAGNLSLYAPIRLGMLNGLYGAHRSLLLPFADPKALARTPALVIVHAGNQWREYGTLLELSDPFLNTPFIFALGLTDSLDQALIAQFPGRQVYHYYPDKPGQFFLQPLP